MKDSGILNTGGSDEERPSRRSKYTAQEFLKLDYKRVLFRYLFHFIIIAIMSSLCYRYVSFPSRMKKDKERVKPLVQNLFGEYLDAQNIFIQNNYSSISGNCINTKNNRYCDNFRNLHYSLDKSGKEIKLISKKFADAFTGIAKGAPIRNLSYSESTPIDGVLFCESESWNPEDDYFKLSAFLIFRGEQIKIYEVDSRYPELLLPVN